MTDAQFIAWLQSPACTPCVLAEVDDVLVSGTPTDFYLSSRGYVTKGSDTPAHTAYSHPIAGGCNISERLSLQGAGGLAVGDIEVANFNGERDAWLTYVWRNRPVRMYVGDMRWPRADFRLVFSGRVLDLDSSARDRLNIKVRDKLQQLDTPVTDATLGGSTANKDRLLPVCLGECHNVDPLLTNPATLQYQVHAGAVERLIEVRDNGVVVATTNSLGTGKFTLNAALKGAITVSVQGDKPSAYANTISTLVQRLATGYGAEPLVSGDLDATNLAAFDSAHPDPVGLYLRDRTTVLEACQRLASSVGAQVVMSAVGELQLVQLGLPAAGTPRVVTGANMLADSLRVSGRPPVRAAVRLGYCPNWTVQTGLQTGVPAEHKDLYGQEWLVTTVADAGVASSYQISEAPTQENTLLLRATDALAEATRRLNLWKTQRTVFAYEAFAELLLEPLGAAQTLQHNRFGLSGGVQGQIITVARNWLALRCSFEVLT